MERVERIKTVIERSFFPHFLEVIDDSHHHIGHAGTKNGGGHYTVRIGSEAFDGKSLVARHKMVYNALDSMMQNEIHAIRIDAFTLLEKNKK